MNERTAAHGAFVWRFPQERRPPHASAQGYCTKVDTHVLGKSMPELVEVAEIIQ